MTEHDKEVTASELSAGGLGDGMTRSQSGAYKQKPRELDPESRLEKCPSDPDESDFPIQLPPGLI